MLIVVVQFLINSLKISMKVFEINFVSSFATDSEFGSTLFSFAAESTIQAIPQRISKLALRDDPKNTEKRNFPPISPLGEK